MTYPLATTAWGIEELDAIQRVVESQRFTMGSEVEAFEREAADHFESKYAVMVNSGSSANLIAVASLIYHPDKLLRPGANVIVPGVSWGTSYFPFTQYGIELRLVDIDHKTLNLDEDLVEEAIDDNTMGVLAVHLMGNPCSLGKLAALCEARDLVLIEDACEAMGAQYMQSHVGTWGRVGTYSTFFSHHISTMEGGLVLTQDEEIYNIARSLRSHGWAREQDESSHLWPEVSDFDRQFCFVLPGYNVRPLEMSGAIGREQLKKLPEIVACRRRNAEIFQQLFSRCSFVQVQHEVEASSWFGFSLVLIDEMAGRRDEVVAVLKEAGIESRPIVGGAIMANPVMRHLPFSIGSDLPESDFVDQNGFFVGNHHYDLTDELTKLRECFERWQ